jgi:hypothetical protein
MAILATFVVSAVAGAVIGVVGVVATVGAVSPSADHVASQTTTDPASDVYGSR